MNNLGKKCFYASFSLHLLLVVVVFFGAGFLVSREKPDDTKIVKVYNPKMLVDALTSGGRPLANALPANKPPSATPPPVTPEVTPHAEPPAAVVTPPPAVIHPPEPPVKPIVEPPVKPVTQPEIKPTPPKPERHHETPKPKDIAAIKPAANKKPVKPVIKESEPEPKPVKKKEPELSEDDLKQVVHTAKAQPKPTSKPRTERHTEAVPKPAAPVTPPGPDPMEVWENQRRQAIQTAMAAIGKNSPSITPVDIPISVSGEGAQEQTNYRDLVFSKYNAAWEPPPELDDNRATAMVSITIYPDGRVIESRIVQPSNNAMMNRSVQAALNKVTFIEPFPTGQRIHPRTYLIKFNLQTKRAIG